MKRSARSLKRECRGPARRAPAPCAGPSASPSGLGSPARSVGAIMASTFSRPQITTRLVPGTARPSGDASQCRRAAGAQRGTSGPCRETATGYQRASPGSRHLERIKSRCFLLYLPESNSTACLNVSLKHFVIRLWFVFVTILYKCNHIVFNSFCLASFSQHNYFETHS